MYNSSVKVSCLYQMLHTCIETLICKDRLPTGHIKDLGNLRRGFATENSRFYSIFT